MYLRGMVSIGENLIKNNDGYLVYNFRGQEKSKF